VDTDQKIFDMKLRDSAKKTYSLNVRDQDFFDVSEEFHQYLIMVNEFRRERFDFSSDEIEDERNLKNNS